MAPPSRPTPRTTPDPRQAYRAQFGRQARHVPTDKFFAAIDDALAQRVSAQEIRVLALREVQRARVAPDDKVQLFIPAARIASVFGIDDILHAINREPQCQIWDQALSSLCDFVCVRGHGIRFTCTNRDLAIKLGGSAVSCMDQKLIIKPFSAYERYYFVDLTRIPSGLDEDVIYDYFVALGLQPIIAPTHVAGSLMSRDRTVWFPQTGVPDALVRGGQPLREILFPGFDTPVYVHHKQRSLNKVVPPSIQRKRAAAEAARPTSDPTLGPVPGHQARPPPLGQSPAAPSSPPPPLVEGTLILERPPPSAPVQDWVKVTRHASCPTASQLSPASEIPVTTSSATEGRLVFGFPVMPTSFELAFSDHDLDEPTAGDADCVAYNGRESVAASPMTLSEPVGSLVAARSILKPRTNTLTRSEFRRRARQAARDLPSLGVPDDRLAAMTAQPSVYAPLVHSCPAVLTPVLDEHTVLRLYSGKSAATHGSDCGLVHRLKHDYPAGDAPAASVILAERIPDDTYRDLLRAYAHVDLFLRTHAPAIYHDPVKVQAICGAAPVSCLQYSHFLLWTDETLASLSASPLGDEYEQFLSPPVFLSLQLVRDDHVGSEEDDSSVASSDLTLDEPVASVPSDDESMGSTEAPVPPRL